MANSDEVVMSLKQLPRSGNSRSWKAIFDHAAVHDHDFEKAPYHLSAVQIREACQHFERIAEKEVRVLCKLGTREARPDVFRERGLFILPVRRGKYVIVKGEGYVDVPPIVSAVQDYESDFPFDLETSRVGNSEMQHLDYAYALSLVRHFVGDDSLVLTIRGRKYASQFDFVAGGSQISVRGVRADVDAGYEGRNRVVLLKAKGGKADNTIIRQLYYPFRQWQNHTSKEVSTLFFQRTGIEYHFWHFGFGETNNYNSIQLVKSGRYRIKRRASRSEGA